MFRPNEDHRQNTLTDNTLWMDPRIREKLEKSWAPIFYEHVFCKIDEKPFAVLYGTTGNPNFPINILLSLEYIKHIKQCNDLELLEDFNFDYLVNYAVGVRTLGEKNLAERTLYYFRERIYNYCVENPGKDDLLFGQFIKLLKSFAKEADIQLDKQRTDTTMFMSNIKKAGRISLAYDVLVKAVKAIPEANMPETLFNVLMPNFKTDVLYHTKSQDGDSKLSMLLNLCQEALTVLESELDMLNSDEVRIVKRFLSEQALTDEQNEKLIPKSKKDISPNSLQSAYDEDATFRRKAEVSQSGYALEISETCNKTNSFQLITDYAVKPNTTSDVEIFAGRIKTINDNTGCTDMYVDGGFHSDKVYQTAEENRIEIHLTNMSGTEPSKKLPITEFNIDEAQNVIIKCPCGYDPIRTAINKNQSIAHFSLEACSKCALYDKCHSKIQRKDCVVRINIKAINAGRERELMKEYRVENTSYRAGIEGSNSALKRKGLEKLDVRGITKSTIVCGLKTTVQNIKRFIKFSLGGYKPKQPKRTFCGTIAPNFI